jgi:hypothetical protein
VRLDKLASPNREQARSLGQGSFPIVRARACRIFVADFIALKGFNECFPYGSLIMQVDFDVPAADVAATGMEASNQQRQPEIDNEQTVAAARASAGASDDIDDDRSLQ